MDPQTILPQSQVDLVTDFERVRAQAIGDLERLRLYAERIQLESQERQEIDHVLVRARGDRFTLGVVGEFRRGKSTFINAILGQGVLPTDALPCSAALTRVRYGPTPVAQITYKSKDGTPGVTETVAIDELVNFVTKLTEEAEERAASILAATVFVPLPFLEHNEIIDTPGLNDSPEMTEVTYGILHELDVAIMVVMPHSPFGKTEAEFLNFLLAHDVGRVIFIVNRIDQVRREADRARIVSEIKRRIQDATTHKAAELYGLDTEEYRRHLQRIGAIQVFGVSSRDAFEAKQQGAAGVNRLEQSGFVAFEHYLQHFLATSRGPLRLRVIVNRLLLSGTKIVQHLQVRAGALEMSQAQFDEAYEDAAARLDKVTVQLDEQMRHLAEVAERTRSRTRALVNQIGPNLKQIADEIIEATELKAVDLEDKRFREFQGSLSQKIADAVVAASQLHAERVQIMLQEEMKLLAARLDDVARSADIVLQEITIRFSEPPGTAPSLTGALLDELKRKNHPVVSGSLALIALSLPSIWPIALVFGIASLFGRRWLSRKFLVQTRIDQFKTQYRASIHAEIDAQLQQHGLVLQEKFDHHVRQSFAALREHTERDLYGRLTSMRATLHTASLERAGHHARSQYEQAEVQQILPALEQILAHARAIEEQIARVLEPTQEGEGTDHV